MTSSFIAAATFVPRLPLSPRNVHAITCSYGGEEAAGKQEANHANELFSRQTQQTRQSAAQPSMPLQKRLSRRGHVETMIRRAFGVSEPKVLI